MDKLLERNLYRAAEHYAILDSNQQWDRRWNGRAAERAQVNSPWPVKESKNA